MTDAKKTTRQRDLVEFAKIEPMLNLLKHHGKDESFAFSSIGYTQPHQKLREARSLGMALRVDFYAIKGLIAELNLEAAPVSKVFSMDFDEAELIFDALRKGREIWLRRIDKLKALAAKVAVHMAEI